MQSICTNNFFFAFLMYADEIEVDEKELEHSSLQEKLGMELKELDKKLEQKEVKFVCSCNVAIRPVFCFC